MNRVLAEREDENVPEDSPAAKKHKIGDGEEMDKSAGTMNISDDDDSSPIIPTYSTYDSEEDYCPDYPGAKMDKPLWERYWNQIEESEGFDITDCPQTCWMLTIYPMRNYLSSTENVDRLKGYVGKALEHYNNSNGTSYEVENILKVNGEGCRNFTYYITFSVKNGENDTFQAKVVEDLDNHLEFPIVRPKGFDITDCPQTCWMLTIYPMPNYLSFPKNVDKMKGYAGKALEHYNNSNGTSYEVENILKVNAEGCRNFTYYITFSVKNGESDTFQAKVVEDLDNHLEFPIVRPKVKATMG